MRREILFKAKRVDNGELVQGHYFYELESSRHLIMVTSHYSGDGREDPPFDFQTSYEVDPETVCQYTGLKDKDGTKIFEGDQCLYRSSKVDQDSNYIKFEGIIEWWDGQTGVGYRFRSGRHTHMIKRGQLFFIEITGNIHDKNK